MPWRGPRMDPPEPNPPCPHCGDDPLRTATASKTEFDDGAVVGDLKCVSCDRIVEQGVLFRNPDLV